MVADGNYDGGDVDHADFVPMLLEGRWLRRLAWGVDLGYLALEVVQAPGLASVKDYCYVGKFGDGTEGGGGIAGAVGAGNLVGEEV